VSRCNFFRFIQIIRMAGTKKSMSSCYGAGFGGLAFCKEFRHPDARITLVDRTNHISSAAALSSRQPARCLHGRRATHPRHLSNRPESPCCSKGAGFDLTQRKVPRKERAGL